jgi:hypothetical protein
LRQELQLILWNDEIYGKFIINANQFIRETIKYMVKYSNENENEERIEKIFDEFCVLYGKLLRIERKKIEKKIF